jgi:TonB family protein
MLRAALLSVSLLLMFSFTLAQNTTSGPTPTSQAPENSASTAPPDSRSLLFRTIVSINYPQAAQDSGTGGLVVVRMTVTESGDVENADIVNADSVLAGAATESIEHAATEAIKQWKFQPYIKDGKPVKASTKLGIRFTITDGKCTDGVKQATVTTPFEHAVTVTEKDMQGYICKKVPVVYPHMAEFARVSGDVVMAATQNLHVLSTASPLLNQSAIDSVRQWHYRPYLVLDKPVPVETTLTVAFR